MNNSGFKLPMLLTMGILASSVNVAYAYSNEDNEEVKHEHSHVFKKHRLVYKDVVKLIKNRGVKAKLAPQVRFTSPINGGQVAPGEGEPDEGSLNGAGFLINLEVLTRDRTDIRVNEATQTPGNPGIRNVDQLGEKNPEFPGLFVFINKDLVTPTGDIIRKNTNLGPLFNVAGSDDTPGRGITTWVGWHVLESFLHDTEKFQITAAVIDNKGRIGFDKIRVNINEDLLSANALTPDPSYYPYESTIDSSGPLVEIVAPRVPSAIALGVQDDIPNQQTGALNFIQVNVLDIADAGIAVDEIGETVTKPDFGPGSILDPAQLGKGANRNFPGLNFTFDVPLLAPTGLLVEAGQNLAPVFNIVGSEVDPLTGATRVVADWVVGGALIMPPGKQFVTFTAIVTDNAGHAGESKRKFLVSSTENGQELTPAP